MAETEEPFDLLHIGNQLRITSAAHGDVTGRVIYRDAALMRFMPQEASDRALEFPLVNDGYGFAPELGVSEIAIIEEQPSDYYVDVLGVKPGDAVEFFTVDGEQAANPGVVTEVVKGERKDNIVLEDGRTIKFRGRGPPAPIAVVRVVTALNRAAAEAVPADALAAEAAAALAAETERQDDLFALLTEVVPTQAAEIIPMAERVFPDSMQREDLFQDLLGELTAKQKTNPRRIRLIEREVDVAMALKNIVVRRDATGRITGVAVKPITTMADAVEVAGAGLPAAIPIVKAARVLNLDDASPGAFIKTDVLPRSYPETEKESATRADTYENTANRTGLDAFLYDVFERDQHVLDGEVLGAGWREDQDVVRTAGLGARVSGLGSGLPQFTAMTEAEIANAGGKNPTAVSLEHVSADVTDRGMRVLAADQRYLRGSASGVYYAPSDPSEVSGYVMLPPKAALALRPPKQPGDLPMALIYSARLQEDNIPTIAATLADLYAGADEAGPLHAWTLEKGAAEQAPVTEWLRKMLAYAVHPADSLGPRTAPLLSLLDTLGLAAADVPSPVAAVVGRWVRDAQVQWGKLLDAQRKEIQKALDTAPPRTYQSVTGDDATIWQTLRTDESLRELMEDIDRRNPSIAEAPTLIAASLTTEAQGDAAPLAWAAIAKVDGHAPPVDPVNAAAALAASRSYALRRKALRDIGLLSLRAEPEINTCPHVKRLEAIRNKGDALQRGRLLREFIDEYQGGSKGDWVTCALCQQESVCYHELMELEALAQPARADAIMKQMLIRFGGDRYQGQIVCRNCGQGLQAIEFDDRPEFDDEGNVIAGYSVLTEEQMAEDAVQPAYKRAVADLAPPPIVYPTPAQEILGGILKRILDAGGMLAQPSTMLMIVQYADRYVSTRAPSQDYVEKQRAALMKAASTRLTKAAGGGGASAIPDIPSYEAILDQFRVSALSALTVIALQAATPPIVVQNPSPHCAFSRGGWPLDVSVDPRSIKIDVPCAVTYVSCVIASILDKTAPWRNMVWFRLPEFPAKQRKALEGTMNALTAVLGVATGAALSFAGEIRAMLEKMRSDKDAARDRALVSIKDQLPLGFRPDPFPPAVGRPGAERDPVPAVEAAIAAGTVTGAEVTGVASAVRQQAMAVVGELHAAASAYVAGITERPTGVSEWACCAATIPEAEGRILLGAPENARLLEARRLIRGAQPAVVNAGTHLWPEFATPIAEPVEQAVEDAVLFKLFLKYCYVGPQVGAPHEFSVGDACRQCGLVLGKPIDLVDFGKEGAAILAQQQGPLKVETTPVAFNALSDAVRRRKLLTEPAAAGAATWQSALAGLVAVARARVDLTDEEGPRVVAAALETVLGGVAAGDPPMGEMDRGLLWAPVDELRARLQMEIGEALGPAVPRGGGGGAAAAVAAEAVEALSTFDRVTEDPFVEGPRAVQEYWCAAPEAASFGLTVEDAKADRWFPIGSGHKTMLNALIQRNYNWYRGGAVTEQMSTALRRIGAALGPIARLWVRSVRPTPAGRPDGAWTKAEAQLLLRAFVLQVWRDALTPTSWVYRDVATPADRLTAAAGLVSWTRALMKHVKGQVVRYTRERVRSIIQQQAELERTTIVQEFQDLKDDDLRAAELVKKQFRIGRWAGGANLTKYDADRFEFERQQREKMGIAETGLDPQGTGVGAPAAAAQDFGLGLGGPVVAEVYDMNQGAAGDDY
jgi:hypothetical protein